MLLQDSVTKCSRFCSKVLCARLSIENSVSIFGVIDEERQESGSHHVGKCANKVGARIFNLKVKAQIDDKERLSSIKFRIFKIAVDIWLELIYRPMVTKWKYTNFDFIAGLSGKILAGNDTEAEYSKPLNCFEGYFVTSKDVRRAADSASCQCCWAKTGMKK
jgi:hypothetical protein